MRNLKSLRIYFRCEGFYKREFTYILEKSRVSFLAVLKSFNSYKNSKNFSKKKKKSYKKLYRNFKKLYKEI